MPPHPQARATYLIGRLDRIVRRRLEGVLASEGLTLAQYTTLSVLAARPGLTNAQMARRSLVSPQGMNQALSGLAEMGLIGRRQHPKKGRRLEIHLTAKGERLLALCCERTDEVEQELLDRLEVDARQSFLDALGTLAEVGE